MNFSQFLFMVEHQLLYFTRISLWDDPFEGNDVVNLKKALRQEEKRIISQGGQIISSPVGYMSKIKNDRFASSWSLLGESDAMWRIYSRDRLGVKIQTTASKLDAHTQYDINIKMSDKDINERPMIHQEGSLGKIVYGKEHVLSRNSDITSFLHKRKPFEHEQEVRSIVRLMDSKSPYLYEPINPVEEFVEKVVIDPRAPAWHVKSVKKYCERFNLHCEQSNLYLFLEDV
ncbi:MAG: hypothetical protein HZA03_02210 [Nitrospinae bacterium]|nr:hypothetical protein [Nitrospinota bacterium]